MQMKSAMIFAAGLGTRLKPLTDSVPKALVEVGGKTLLQTAIEKIRESGFQQIVINTHHFAEKIEEFVERNDFGIKIIISREKKLLDTGGGIFYAKEKIGESAPFFVHNVDILSNVDLKKFYGSHNPETIATLLTCKRETSRYLLFDNQNHLVGWENIKTGEIKSPFKNLNSEKYNRLAFGGIHVISPNIFRLMKNMTMTMPFSIIDFYLSICDKEKIVSRQYSNLQIIDVGTVEKLNFALKYYNKFISY
jgi:NDP-sugar pyrophosphorylase family protein